MYAGVEIYYASYGSICHRKRYGGVIPRIAACNAKNTICTCCSIQSKSKDDVGFDENFTRGWRYIVRVTHGSRGKINARFTMGLSEPSALTEHEEIKEITMAICYFTGKRRQTGNSRSHALNTTKRAWNANLQRRHMIIDGRMQTVIVSASALKTMAKSSK